MRRKTAPRGSSPPIPVRQATALQASRFSTQPRTPASGRGSRRSTDRLENSATRDLPALRRLQPREQSPFTPRWWMLQNRKWCVCFAQGAWFAPEGHGTMAGLHDCGNSPNAVGRSTGRQRRRRRPLQWAVTRQRRHEGQRVLRNSSIVQDSRFWRKPLLQDWILLHCHCSLRFACWASAEQQPWT